MKTTNTQDLTLTETKTLYTTKPTKIHTWNAPSPIVLPCSPTTELLQQIEELTKRDKELVKRNSQLSTELRLAREHIHDSNHSFWLLVLFIPGITALIVSLILLMT